ncbi:MAG: hypothetical protein ACYTGP_08110, partial [Planctomycetota bacterium]
MRLLLILALWGLPAGVAAAQAPAPAADPATGPLGFPEETAFAFDQEQAEAWREAMIPVVEEVAGRRFTSRPELTLVTRRALGEIIVAEQLALLERLEPDETDDQVRLELELDVLVRTPVTIGRYAQQRGHILLAAGNVRPLMALGGVPESALPSVMKLVVAHELAHALHRQHVDVPRQLGRLRTRDQALAQEAMSEGFAMYVQERVATKLGMEPAQAQLVTLMSGAGFEGEIAVRQQQRYQRVYDAGWTFFRAHAEAGTDGAPWSLLDAPPLTYGQIREPLRYGEPVAMEMNARRLFREIGPLVGAGDWVRTVMTVDPRRVGETFAPLGEDVAKEVAANVGPAYNLVLAQNQGGMPTVRTVSAIELKEPVFGPRLLELTTQLKDRQFQQVLGLVKSDEDAFTVDVVKPVPVPSLEAAASTRFRLDVSQKDPPATMVFVIAAAHRGTWAVQFTGNGSAIDDADIARAMTTVFDRAESGDGLVPVAWVDEKNPLVRAMARLDEVMVDAPWKGRYRELTKSDLSAQLGADVSGQIAIELGFVRGQVGDFAQEASDPALTVLLVELNEDELTEGLASALVTRSRISLDQVSAIPGAEIETG